MSSAERVSRSDHLLSSVLAYLLPIMVLGGLVAVMATDRAPASISPDQGQAGVGDPYFPDYGSSGYDALSYRIAVDWDPGSQALTGDTTISARASQPLASFFVDLALDVRQATVDGIPATITRDGFQDVEITPSRPIACGAIFQVAISYQGQPGSLHHTSGFSAAKNEWTFAGEPESSVWWFPANDHPSDPALMDVSVRVPAGMEAISVGRLESRDSADEANFDTWHWVADQPMATYLNFLSIGKFQIEQGMTDGLPYVYAVSEQLTPPDRRRAMSSLRTTGRVIKTLEQWYGPYPFTELGGVVPAANLWFAGLETQTRPVYEATAIVSPKFSQQLIAHELGHMWFGDNVTIRQWNDIFNNEAYGSYSAWLYAEETAGADLNRRLNDTYDDYAGNPRFWRVTMINPGLNHLFDQVYERGPMALQALRNLIGDQDFFRFNRQWAQKPGTRSTEDWMQAVQASTPVDLQPYFDSWIYGDHVPARSAANGFKK